MHQIRVTIPWRSLRVRVCFGVCLLCAIAVCGSATAAPIITVRIGVLAHRGIAQCLSRWIPLAGYLESHLPATRVEIVPLYFDQLIHATRQQAIDFVLTQPLMLTMLMKQYGVSPVVTLRNRWESQVLTAYGGAVIVSSFNDALHTYPDLRGRRVAAVNRHSFGGFIAQWRECQQFGIEPDRDFAALLFLDTHDAVIQAVLDGTADAGFVRSGLVEALERDALIPAGALQVLPPPLPLPRDYPLRCTTRLYPEWTLGRCRATTVEQTTPLAQSLLRMTPEDPAARALGISGWASPANFNALESCIRELDLLPGTHGRMTVGRFVQQYRFHLSAAALLTLVLFSVQLIRITLLNRALRHEKQRLDLAVAITGLGMWEWHADTDQLQPNEQWYRLTGCAPTAAADPGAAWCRCVHADDAGALIPRLQSFLESDARNFEAEFRLQHPARGLIWVHVHASVRERDPSGRPRHMMALYLDLTERKNAELRIRQNEENLRITLDSIGDGLITTDTQGLVSGMNRVAAVITGWCRADALGRPLAEVLPLRDAASGAVVPDLARLVIGSGEAQRLSTGMALVARDGRRIRVANSAAPIRDPQGALQGAVIVFRDVTDQHRLEQDLRQAQKMEAIGQLSGGIAHDFNNMLAGIMGMAEVIAMQLPEGSDVRGYIDTILQTSERAASLTGKLLAFARKSTAAAVPVDLHEIIRATTTILSRSLDKRIIVCEDLQAANPVVMGDPATLQNVLLNLCLNARDAMPRGGDLRISSDTVTLDQATCDCSSFDLTPGTFVRIRVSDTGTGISAADQGRIFEPFYTTKEVGSGSGLGLSAAYGTVVSCQGSITVDSLPDQGTTFTLLLPCTDDRGAAQRVVPDAQPPAGQGRLVLVIDDEPTVRMSVRAMLDTLGYEVLLAEDGLRGVDMFREHRDRIAVVILDMLMPGQDGRVTFTQLQQIDPAVRVLLASGFYPSPEGLERIRQQGLCGFIAKPYTRGELGRAVAAVWQGASWTGGAHPH